MRGHTCGSAQTGHRHGETRPRRSEIGKANVDAGAVRCPFFVYRRNGQAGSRGACANWGSADSQSAQCQQGKPVVGRGYAMLFAKAHDFSGKDVDLGLSTRFDILQHRRFGLRV